MVEDGKQTIAIGRQINAHYFRALVGNDVEEAGILVGEAVVVLFDGQ